MTWRPMATAPKDGTPVLLSSGGEVVIGWCWSKSKSAGWSVYDPVGIVLPDRWQPLPAAWKAPAKKG